eukprot:9081778-Lingulodinium_polyedra.AAC.1
MRRLANETQQRLVDLTREALPPDADGGDPEGMIRHVLVPVPPPDGLPVALPETRPPVPEALAETPITEGSASSDLALPS